MKKSNQYWCGAAFFAMCTYVLVQSFSNPLYAGLTGGACAVASVVLLGLGFRSAEQAQRVDQEREQNNLKAQNQSSLTALNQVQQRIETLYQEVHGFRTDTNCRLQTAEQSDSELKALLKENFREQQKNHTEIVEQIQKGFASVQQQQLSLCQTMELDQSALKDLLRDSFDSWQKKHQEDIEQIQKGFISVCQQVYSLHEVINQTELMQERFCQLLADLNQKTELVQKSVKDGQDEVCKSLATQDANAQEYYGYMISQPWEDLKTLSVSAQSLSEQLENVATVVDDLQEGWNKQSKLILNEMQTTSAAQEELIQNLCQTLEKQGLENRKGMEQLMSAYSDVTSQDVKVLSQLAKEIKK